jgi:hypothetical protein
VKDNSLTLIPENHPIDSDEKSACPSTDELTFVIIFCLTESEETTKGITKSTIRTNVAMTPISHNNIFLSL